MDTHCQRQDRRQSTTRVDILLAAMDGNSSRISLRQRGRQALAHTGWLSPTHDVLPAAGAAVATYVVTLVTAPTGTPVDKRAVGFPLAAGVIALVGVFLVVNLIEFTVNFVKAGPRLRIEADRRRQDSLIATAQDTTIMEWLRQQLGPAGVACLLCRGVRVGDAGVSHP